MNSLCANSCYECGAERDSNSFFWLVIIEKYDIADAQHLLNPFDAKIADKCIQVEVCPYCHAEQT